jgi:hypothetical protein
MASTPFTYTTYETYKRLRNSLDHLYDRPNRASKTAFKEQSDD